MATGSAWLWHIMSFDNGFVMNRAVSTAGDKQLWLASRAEQAFLVGIYIGSAIFWVIQQHCIKCNAKTCYDHSCLL